MKLNVKFHDHEENFDVLIADKESDIKVLFDSVQTITTGGTRDYDRLNNRPRINGHELTSGENSLSSLGIGLGKASDISKLFQ